MSSLSSASSGITKHVTSSEELLASMSAVGGRTLPVEVLPYLPNAKKFVPLPAADLSVQSIISGVHGTTEENDRFSDVRGAECEGDGLSVSTVEKLLEEMGSTVDDVVMRLSQDPQLSDTSYCPQDHIKVFRFKHLIADNKQTLTTLKGTQNIAVQARDCLRSLIANFNQQHLLQINDTEARYSKAAAELDDLKKRFAHERAHLREACAYKVKQEQEGCSIKIADLLHEKNQEFKALYAKIEQQKNAHRETGKRWEEETKRQSVTISNLQEDISRMHHALDETQTKSSQNVADIKTKLDEEMREQSSKFEEDRNQLVDVLEQLSFSGEETQSRALITDEEQTQLEHICSLQDIHTTDILSDLETKEAELLLLTDTKESLSKHITSLEAQNLKLADALAHSISCTQTVLPILAGERAMSGADLYRVYFMRLRVFASEAQRKKLTLSLQDASHSAELEKQQICARYETVLRDTTQKTQRNETLWLQEAKIVGNYLESFRPPPPPPLRSVPDNPLEVSRQLSINGLDSSNVLGSLRCDGVQDMKQFFNNLSTRTAPTTLTHTQSQAVSVSVRRSIGSGVGQMERNQEKRGSRQQIIAHRESLQEHHEFEEDPWDVVKSEDETVLQVARQAHLQSRELAIVLGEFSKLVRKRLPGFACFSLHDICNARETALLTSLTTNTNQPTSQIPISFTLLQIVLNSMKALNKLLFLHRSVFLMKRKLFAVLLTDARILRSLHRRLREKISSKVKAALRSFQTHLQNKRSTMLTLRAEALRAVRGVGRYSADKVILEIHTVLTETQKEGFQIQLQLCKGLVAEAAGVSTIARRQPARSRPQKKVAANFNQWEASVTADAWAQRNGVSSIASFDVPARCLPAEGSLRKSLPTMQEASAKASLMAQNVLLTYPMLGCPAEMIPRREGHTAALPRPVLSR